MHWGVKRKIVSDVFVSYANQDRERARKFVAILGARGWTVFWDRTIPTGRTWREIIGEELERTKCVVVLWSKDSVNSAWVHEEADDGLRRKILIPVRIDDVPPPIGFGSIQTADLSRWRGGKGSPLLRILLQDIHALVGDPSPVPVKKARATRKKAKGKQPDSTTRPSSVPDLGEAAKDSPPKKEKIGLRERFAAAAFILLLVAIGFYVGRKQVDKGPPPPTAAQIREQEVAETRKRDQTTWETAQAQNTIASYTEYKSLHPDGMFTSEADRHIAVLREAEQKRKEEEAVRRAAEETKRRQDENAWELAKKQSSVEGYQAYLDAVADGRYRTFAQEHIDVLQKKKKSDEETARKRAEEEKRAREILAALQKLEDRAREEDEKRKAEEKQRQLDEDSWLTVTNENSVASYTRYLQAFPNGRYRE